MDFYNWYTPSKNFIIHDYVDEAPHNPPLKKYSMHFFFINPLPPIYIKRLEQFNIFDCYCYNPNTIKGISFYSKSLNLSNKWKLIRTLKTGAKEEKRISQSTVYLN